MKDQNPRVDCVVDPYEEKTITLIFEDVENIRIERNIAGHILIKMSITNGSSLQDSINNCFETSDLWI